jgi:hypothetical protein
VSSILSDELLQALVAVGEVDVVVGLPTLNHSETVAIPVRAAHVAFNRELARQRTVLLNVDGGSTDGTPDIVRDASIIERETLLTSHSLRTRHRISAPYHGVPGKASALRTVFAAADLLHPKAVVVLDPEVVSVTPESIAALVRPVLAGEVDFASPLYARHPLDGPLITQVVRPLFRTAYGLRLSEPLAGEVACSEHFVTRCLELPDWETDLLRAGVDLWLTAVAAVSSFRVAEVRLGPRRLAPRARLSVAALVPQVLGALFDLLRLHEAFWTARTPFPSPSSARTPPPRLPRAASIPKARPRSSGRVSPRSSRSSPGRCGRPRSRRSARPPRRPSPPWAIPCGRPPSWSWRRRTAEPS